jgi:hypothetical protein
VSLQDATVPESDEFYAAILVLFARWCTVLKRRGRLPKCIAITFLDHTQGDTSNTEDTLTKSHTQSLLLNAKSSSIETSGTLMDNCLDANARMTRLLTEKAVPDSRKPIGPPGIMTHNLYFVIAPSRLTCGSEKSKNADKQWEMIARLKESQIRELWDLATKAPMELSYKHRQRT